MKPLIEEDAYRRWKIKLNKYHKFSFKMPKKGKAFNPQQKVAINNQKDKLEKTIAKITQKDEFARWSFIPKQKGISMEKLKELPHVEVTNKGIFFPRPGAEIHLVKDTKVVTDTKTGKKKTVKTGHKKAKLETRFRQLIQHFFLFPLEILGNMELIIEYVEELIKKKNPHNVMWAVNDFIGTVKYEPDRFYQYASRMLLNPQFKDDFDYARDVEKDFLTGVYLEYEKVSKLIK